MNRKINNYSPKYLNSSANYYDLDMPASYFFGLIQFPYRWNYYMQQFQNTLNSYPYPYTNTITGDNYSLNQILVKNNSFVNNYASISNALFIQGSLYINVTNNTFSQNSIPIIPNYNLPNFLSNGFYTLLQKIPTFPNESSLPTNVTNVTSPVLFIKESSPLLVRIGNKINIFNCIFDNNTQIFTNDFIFGDAIMLSLMVGRNGINVSNCTFSNHVGFPSSLVNYSANMFNFSHLPLITLNFYAQLHVSPWLPGASYRSFMGPWDLPISNNMTINSCIFTNNVFNFVTDPTGYLTQDSTYPYKIGWLLKYYFYSETQRLSPTNDIAYYSTTPVLVQNISVAFINNILTNTQFLDGNCPISSVIYTNFTFQNNSFTSVTGPTLVNTTLFPYLAGFTSALVCHNSQGGIDSWYSSRIFTMNNNTFTSTTGAVATIYNITGGSVSFNQLNIANSTSPGPYILINTLGIPVPISNFFLNNSTAADSTFDIQNAATTITISNLSVSNFSSSMATVINCQFTSYLILNNVSIFNLNLTTVYQSQSITNNPNLFTIMNMANTNCTVTNGTFNNLVTGVTIYSQSSSSVNTLAMTNVTFSNNQNQEALLFLLLQFILTSVTLTNNSCIASVMTSCTTAGFFASSVNISIINSTFNNNSAQSSTNFLTMSSSVTITNSVFSNNYAVTFSSVFSFTLGTLTVTNSNFTNNNGITGSNLIINQATFIFSNVNFLGNAATQGSKNLIIKDSQGSITNCTFNDTNTTNSDYGSIFFQDGNLTLVSVNIFGSYARSAAVALSSSKATFLINSTNIYNCNSTAISITGSSSFAYINNVVFLNNSAQNTSQGSDIYAYSGPTLAITNTTFTNFTYTSIVLQSVGLSMNFCSMLGRPSLVTSGISCVPCESMTINNSIISNMNSASSCGAAVSYLADAQNTSIPSIIMSNNTFVNNSAQNGGSLCILTNYTSQVINTQLSAITFANNTASQSGGAIYYTCQNLSCTFQLSSNTQFTSCFAGISGGAYQFTALPITSSDNTTTYTNNTAAVYGPLVAAYPVTMYSLVPAATSSRRFLQNSSNGTIIINDITYNIIQNGTISLVISGDQLITPPLLFVLVDEFGQYVLSDNSSKVSVQSNDSQLAFDSPSSFVAISGVYNLTYLKILYPPGLSVSISLVSTAINTYGRTFPSSIGPTVLTMQTVFQNCTPGQILASNLKSCQTCASGLYSISTDFSVAGTCYPCPDNLVCEGADTVYPDSGYWRLGYNSTRAISCVYAPACLGGNLTYNQSLTATCATTLVDGQCNNSSECLCYYGFCRQYTTGNLCSNCISDYAKDMSGNCVPCSTSLEYYLVTGIIVIVVIAFMIVSVRTAINLKEGDGFAALAARKKNNSLIRIMTNYVQMISIMSSYDFDWSLPFQQLFSVGSSMSSGVSNVFTLDCIMEALFYTKTSIRPFFLKLTATAMIPIIISLVSFIIWTLIYFVQYKTQIFKHRKDLFRKVITTVTVLVFMVHTSVVYTCLTSIKCNNIGMTQAPSYWLAADFDIECWSGEHWTYFLEMALPAFIFWGVGIPVLIFTLIYRAKQSGELETFDFKFKYGFLFEGYKRQYYYWEFVIMARKVLMVVVSLFFVAYGDRIESLAVFATVFISYVMHLKLAPYSDELLNVVELISLMAGAITIYFGLYFAAGNVASYTSIVFFVITIFVNAYFIYTFLVNITEEVMKRLQQNPTFVKIMEKLKLWSSRIFYSPQPEVSSYEPDNQVSTTNKERRKNLSDLRSEDQGLERGLRSLTPLSSPSSSLRKDYVDPKYHNLSLVQGDRNNYLKIYASSGQNFDITGTHSRDDLEVLDERDVVSQNIKQGASFDDLMVEEEKEQVPSGSQSSDEKYVKSRHHDKMRSLQMNANNIGHAQSVKVQMIDSINSVMDNIEEDDAREEDTPLTSRREAELQLQQQQSGEKQEKSENSDKLEKEEKSDRPEKLEKADKGKKGETKVTFLSSSNQGSKLIVGVLELEQENSKR